MAANSPQIPYIIIVMDVYRCTLQTAMALDKGISVRINSQ